MAVGKEQFLGYTMWDAFNTKMNDNLTKLDSVVAKNDQVVTGINDIVAKLLDNIQAVKNTGTTYVMASGVSQLTDATTSSTNWASLPSANGTGGNVVGLVDTGIKFKVLVEGIVRLSIDFKNTETANSRSVLVYVKINGVNVNPSGNVDQYYKSVSVPLNSVPITATFDLSVRKGDFIEAFLAITSTYPNNSTYCQTLNGKLCFDTIASPGTGFSN